VQFDPGIDWSLLDLMTMEFELSTLLDRHVDLVEPAGLRNPFRRAAIIQSKQVVYASLYAIGAQEHLYELGVGSTDVTY
jgi:hypothetical protein